MCVCSCDCLKKETKSLGSRAGPLEQQTVGPLKSLWSCPNLEKLNQSIFSPSLHGTVRSFESV